MKIKSLQNILSSYPKEVIINKCFSKEISHLSEKEYQELIEESEDTKKIIKDGYERAINELLSLTPPPRKEQHTIEILYYSNENDPFVEVCLRNDYFVQKPPDRQKYRPWGGNENDKHDHPTGHYNVNWIGYQDYLQLDKAKRSQLLTKKISIDPLAWEICSKSYLNVCVEILYELVFYGFTEKESIEFWNETSKTWDK